MTLAFLDGATVQWVSDRFDLTSKEVGLSRQHIEVAIKRHYADQGVSITDFEVFARENIDDLIGLLVTWADLSSRPIVAIPEPEQDPEASDKKIGASQGENGENPDSP